MLQRPELRDEGTSLDRVRSLSDCVFAFSMTLLVINLQVPKLERDATDVQILTALRGQMPVFVGYFTSFAVIGLLWVVHHRMFRHIVRFNRRLLNRNLVFLFVVTILPFATALSDTFSKSGLAWTVYASTIALSGLALVAVWQMAWSHRFVGAEVTPLLCRYLTARCAVPPVSFLISTAFVPYNAEFARACPLVIIPLTLAVERHFYRVPDDSVEAEADPTPA